MVRQVCTAGISSIQFDLASYYPVPSIGSMNTKSAFLGMNKKPPRGFVRGDNSDSILSTSREEKHPLDRPSGTLAIVPL